MPKTRINISLDQDLADFARLFATEQRTTVADMVTQFLLALKRKIEGQETATFLADPAFHATMEEARKKLQSGKARWHTYDEVFKN